MSEADPHGVVKRSSATPEGSLDSPTADAATAFPRAPSPSTAASIFNAAHATAPWPGVAFPRHRAKYIPVGGAAAVIMSPTPPRYISGAPAAPTATTAPPATKTPNRASGHGKMGLLSASSSMVSQGLKKMYGNAMIIGAAATDFCIWAGMPVLPRFFKAHVTSTSWAQLPGFFSGLSCVLEGADEVFEGSSQALGAMHGSSWVFHGAMRGSAQVFRAICSYIPSAGLASGKAHDASAGCSYPQQGINTVLSYHIIKRSYVDSVLIVQDSNGSRKSPKKVLPRVQIIRTLKELEAAVAKFKNGEPVHLIDVSEQDVSLDLALYFWKILLEEGATALLRRDSNLCRMSKMAYSLVEEKEQLESQLHTLNNKVDDVKRCITLVSDMLLNTKAKSGRSINFSNDGVNSLSTSIATHATSDEQKAKNLLASQASEFNTKPAAANMTTSGTV